MTGQVLQACVPEEPGSRTVGLDRMGTAWQRDGQLWWPAASTHSLSPLGWLELVVNRGPLTVVYTPDAPGGQ